MKKTNLESLRTQLWMVEKTADKLQKDIELLKYQIAEIKSNEKDNSNSGVEAAQIDPSRILSRRGSKAKKLALAIALNMKK